MKRTIVVFSVVVLALSLTAFAAEKNGASTSPDGRVTYFHGAMAGVSHPSPDLSAGTWIFQLLDPQAKGRYFCCYGETISGANSVIGAAYWGGQGFTPASNSHITSVKAGIGYVEGTYTDVILSIDLDCSGVPCGTPVWSKKVTVSGTTFGSCCGIVSHRVNPPVAVTGGTQYWITATTEAASDIWAAWNFEVLDEVDNTNIAYNSGGTWYSYSYFLGYSVSAAGTVP